MRFSTMELQYLDILWFAIDTKGNIATFTSAGESFVPEFVCRSKEETDYLEDYFLNQLNESTDYMLCSEDSDNTLMNDFKLLANKGLFCYDSCNSLESDYSLCSYPKSPINVNNLPIEVKKILLEHTLKIDFMKEKYLNIEKAIGRLELLVSCNSGDYSCASWIEVKNLIMQSQNDKYDDIWISGNDEYPCLSILINQKDTCIHYYLNNDGEMWQSVGNADKNVLFVSNNDMSTLIEMSANTIVPLYKAIQCVKQFCIEWRKL